MAAGQKRQSGWKTARHSDCLFSRLYSRFRAGLGFRNTLENAVDLKLWEMKPNDEGIQVAHFISEVTLRPGLNTVVTNAALRRDFLHHGVRFTREKSSGMRSIAASSANKCSNSNHTGKPD